MRTLWRGSGCVRGGPCALGADSMGSNWLGAVPPLPAAPEQLLGERCTFAADIYRWGRLGLCCCGPADCHLRLWECVIHCCAPYWLLKCQLTR